MENNIDWWKNEFQYLLNRKILSRDEMAELFGQIKSVIDRENYVLKQRIGKLERQTSGLLETIETTEIRERETIVILNKENGRLRQIIKENAGEALKAKEKIEETK